MVESFEDVDAIFAMRVQTHGRFNLCPFERVVDFLEAELQAAPA